METRSLRLGTISTQSGQTFTTPTHHLGQDGASGEASFRVCHPWPWTLPEPDGSRRVTRTTHIGWSAIRQVAMGRFTWLARTITIRFGAGDTFREPASKAGNSEEESSKANRQQLAGR